MRYLKGDEIVVMNKLHGHGFKVGDKGIITKVLSTSYLVQGDTDWWFLAEEELDLT